MALFTITSDLGNTNYLTAAVKGAILASVPQASIVELSSTIQSFNIYEASYIFKSAYHYFAPNTHHLILCGLFNSDYKDLLVTQFNNHFIYFVDNGFAPLCLSKNQEIFALKLEPNFEFSLMNIAKTFAQGASFINKGVQLSQFTVPYDLKYIPNDIDPIVQENSVVAQVIYIDNFKNVVVNLTKQEFEEIAQGRKVRMEFTGNTQINTISTGYNDVPIGNKVCFFNDAGYLEIAVRGGNASELFGFEVSGGKKGIYNTVTLHFDND